MGFKNKKFILNTHGREAIREFFTKNVIISKPNAPSYYSLINTAVYRYNFPVVNGDVYLVLKKEFTISGEMEALKLVSGYFNQLF